MPVHDDAGRELLYLLLHAAKVAGELVPGQSVRGIALTAFRPDLRTVLQEAGILGIPGLPSVVQRGRGQADDDQPSTYNRTSEP